MSSLWEEHLIVSDFRPCRECRDWRTCLLTETEKDWFDHIDCWRLCPLHVFFLLRYESVLRGHRWPVVDENTGGMTNRVVSDAVFTKASLLLAELYQRLDRTGLKGELLAEQCKVRDKVEYLSDNAKDALFYVSGDKRKLMSFVDWLRKRRERHGKRDMAKIAQS